MGENNEDRLKFRLHFEQEQIARQAISQLSQVDKDNEALKAMEATLQVLRNAKPNERGELARRYAVAITEYEKSLAYFKFYVVDQN